MPRALLLALLVSSLTASAQAQDGAGAVPEPPAGDAPDGEPPDEIVYAVPATPPELDAVADELHYYRPGEAPRAVNNDTEAPRRPDGSGQSSDASDETYVPAGAVHSVIALRLGSVGALDDSQPVTRAGALYLVDIRPWADSAYRMRFGVGFSIAVSSPVVLTYYLRLLPLSVDLGRALVFRLGADVGLAYLFDIEARALLGPVFEIVLPIEDGHVEIGIQASFPLLIGDDVSNLWTLGLMLAYVF